MPGNVVETDTISKDIKKSASIIDRLTKNVCLGLNCTDWSARETCFRSGPPEAGVVSSSGVATIADEEVEMEEASSAVDEGDILDEVMSVMFVEIDDGGG